MKAQEPTGAEPPLAKAEIGNTASMRPVAVSHCGAMTLEML